MRIKDLYFGKNDGKEEAAFNQDFDHFYFNYDDNYSKILQPDKFLLLGRKGSGKSILAEYILKESKKSENPWFCEIVSYKEFNFNEMIFLKSENVTPNEYTEIWHWLTLINISKMLLKDQSLTHNLEYEKLRRFFIQNYNSIEIDSNKVIQITKKNEINASFLKEILSLGGGTSSEKLLETGSYINYIENLECTVIELLQKSNNKYNVIFDELDDKFQNESTYKSILISLIKNTARLNRKLFSLGTKCKIMVLMRTDIMNILNDPDLNKIYMDNSVTIDWGDSVNKFSPLLQMIYTKIRKSMKTEKAANKISDYEIYSTFLPDNISTRTSEEYILGRTFFRPRDVVTYFNLITNNRDFGNSDRFEWFHFTKCEQQYSDYFFREIKNEMCGHFSDSFISESFKLLSQFRKVEFTYSEILKFFEESKIFQEIEVDKALDALFKFGALGNKWYNDKKDRYFYSWNYRMETEIDYGKTFVIHLGLRKALGCI